MSERTVAAAAPGEVIFARYAYPPNELGYCGADTGREWLDIAGGAGRGAFLEQTIADRARSFDGAWPYLEFLAHTAGVADPLDATVTTAYWVGNELLDAVDPTAFAAFALRSFGTQHGADWRSLDVTLSGGPTALPHHSFHVFTVYPWTGVLRRTGSAQALQVLDRCRIRWGSVVAIDGDTLLVRSRPLTWVGRALGLGSARVESVRWADDGRSLLPSVERGDRVSLHWGWVCDVLTAEQVESLRRLTERQLLASNQSAG